MTVPSWIRVDDGPDSEECSHAGLRCRQGVFRQRAKTVALLVRDGFLSQILLSHDICMKSSLHWYGGTGYDYLLTQFVPLLLSEGLTESEVHTMLVENPRRALAFDV